MQNQIKQRTKQFALDVIDLIELLPKNTSSKVIAYQLVKCATSVGANYRAACRARSDNEFVSKLQIVLEEADESTYWLEMIQAKSWVNVDKLMKESNELTAIFASSLITMKNKKSQKPSIKYQVPK